MASALRRESGELGSIPGGHNVFAGSFICMGFFAWHCWALRGAFLRSVFAKDWSWRALSRRSRWARLFSHLSVFLGAMAVLHRNFFVVCVGATGF